MGINSTTDMQDAYTEIYKILQREIKYINGENHHVHRLGCSIFYIIISKRIYRFNKIITLKILMKFLIQIDKIGPIFIWESKGLTRNNVEKMLKNELFILLVKIYYKSIIVNLGIVLV